MAERPSNRLSQFLHGLEDTILVVLVAALIGVACGQIILRNLFSITWLWADPLIRHLVLWSGLIGALIATRQDKHIKIDALARLLPSQRYHQMLTLSRFVSTGVCAWLAWISVDFVIAERGWPSDGPLGLPLWQWQLIFPFTFGCMALRFLFQLYADFLGDEK
ncbi:MAG: TRAP transporter small permease subunit [Candidatus Latescibacteria bacterium]|nr:TRAP transporter small permease subunit [Candidatus Latescibacterota bacterium]